MLKNAKGIDVSHHQGEIQWEKVKADGIGFAVIRAGFGNSASQKDTRFEENIKGALAAGIPAGAYWFSYAVDAEDARKEAEVCRSILKPWKDRLTLPVFFDFEYDSEKYNSEVTYTRQGRTDIIRAFCEAMEGYGYKAGYYTNKDYIQNRIHREQLSYDLWLADYSGEPDYACSLQQTSSTGKVDGISGNVDMNVCFADYGEAEMTEAAEEPAEPAGPSAPAAAPAVYYRVRTQAHGWLPEVKGLADYAGYQDSPITDIAVRVTAGTVKYRVHVLGGGWLPYVTGCDINDSKSGYAGSGKAIDAVEVYYYTPKGQTVRRAKYRVAPTGGGYYPWQYDNETTGGQDGYAGAFSRRIGKLQITLE